MSPLVEEKASVAAPQVVEPDVVPGRPYHMAGGVEICRVGNDVEITDTEGRAVPLRRAQWVAGVATTMHVGNSPEARGILEWMMDASPQWVEWLGRRVNEAREMHGPAPQD